MVWFYFFFCFVVFVACWVLLFTFRLMLLVMRTFNQQENLLGLKKFHWVLCSLLKLWGENSQLDAHIKLRNSWRRGGKYKNKEGENPYKVCFVWSLCGAYLLKPQNPQHPSSSRVPLVMLTLAKDTPCVLIEILFLQILRAKLSAHLMTINSCFVWFVIAHFLVWV